MATRRYTQFSYLPDPKNGEEYWIYGYNPEKPGDSPEMLEKMPFGELFTRFIDMDGALLTQIRGVLERFATLQSPEDYIKNWLDFRDAVWKLDAVTEQMPPVFIDFVAVLDFYFKEYLVNSAQKADFGKGDTEKMIRGARILRDYCDRIDARRSDLLAGIQNGVFAPGKPEAMAEALVGAARIIDCSLQARCIFIRREGLQSMELCYDTGADLAGFTTAFLSSLAPYGLGIINCGNCGKPFISGGRTVYCARKAKGGSCRAVGAISKYNRKLSEDPAAAEYRREYKKYYAQMMKGVITRGQFEEWKAQNKQ